MLLTVMPAPNVAVLKALKCEYWPTRWTSRILHALLGLVRLGLIERGYARAHVKANCCVATSP
jgi:hypothetical protein